jgi:endo-1,4-beta-D-glucanase Y
LIKVLKKRRKFNTGYHIAEIFEPFSQWRSIEAADKERRLLAHADNACLHPAKLSTQYFNENRMKSAPADFYLFGYAKKCLAGLSFEDADQVLTAVEGIEKVTLEAFCLEWIDRLRKRITTNGEYTE